MHLWAAMLREYSSYLSAQSFDFVWQLRKNGHNDELRIFVDSLSRARISNSSLVGIMHARLGSGTVSGGEDKIQFMRVRFSRRPHVGRLQDRQRRLFHRRW